MRRIVILICTTLTTLRGADTELSNVRFANNDRLIGTLASLTPERLTWDSPLLENPVSFHLEKIFDLTLTDAAIPDIKGNHEATVVLTNGDTLRGALASVSDSTIHLDTSFGGRLALNRLMVTSITITERPNLIYRGPTGIEDWKQSGEESAWTYQNAAFRSNGAGGIAKNVKLPDECRIAFDVEWRSTLSLKLVFFSDNIETEQPANGYEINFQKRFAYFRNCKTQMSIGNTSNAVALQENEKARIEIRASIRTGTVCFFVNDVIVDVWTDSEVAKLKPGRGIHFVSQKEFPLRISRIEVGEWDGEIDRMPDPVAPGFQFGRQNLAQEKPIPQKNAVSADRMNLRNGDSITGEVLAIDAGKVRVKTPFREILLPLETLSTVALKPVDLERCKRQNGDVRAWMPDGSSLVFRLEQVGDNRLEGSSQNFGKASFRMDAFNRIEFNIYDPDFQDSRAKSDW